jgi:hypothetical protein
MPPVMITSPSPRLKIPNAPMRRAVFCRFASDMKRGFSAVTIAHNTTSSRKVANSFFTLTAIVSPPPRRESLRPALSPSDASDVRVFLAHRGDMTRATFRGVSDADPARIRSL